MEESERITKPSPFESVSCFSKTLFGFVFRDKVKRLLMDDHFAHGVPPPPAPSSPRPSPALPTLFLLNNRWVFPLFFEGYNKDLALSDLYKCPKNDEAQKLVEKLDRQWQRQVKTKNPSLAKAIWLTFGLEAVVINLIGVFEECFVRVAQPLILGLVVRFFTNRDQVEPLVAYLSAAGVCMFALVFIISHHPFFLGTFHVGMRIRVACTGLVYRKMLRLSKSSMTRTAVGHIINLLSNDVNRFDELIMYLGYLVLGPAQSVIIIAILWYYLGAACLAGVVVLLLFIPFQALMGKLFGEIRRKTASLTDQRIRLMSEIISGMRVIKMYSWEKPFADSVKKARKKEVNQIRNSCLLKAINLTIFFVATKVILCACFVTYVLTNGHLSAETVFVTMYLFNALRFTMTFLFPLSISTGAEALVSCKRIETFLFLEEQQSLTGFLIKGTGEPEGIKVSNLVSRWEEEATEPTLRDISFDVKPGQLLAVIGTVGSGKSTLLMSLLGELPHSSGKVAINGKVAYASQEPWSFNGSIRENILFGREYQEERYKEVIRVSALERDLKLFVFGDKTLVGEKGVSMSGGQKARVSLARALYTEADIYFLDDPLSAVDTAVANHIFDKCVSEHLSRKATILVTHQLQFIKKADLILVLKEGKSIAKGSYHELINSGIDFVSLLKKDDDQEKEERKVKERDFQKSLDQMIDRRLRSCSRQSSVSEQSVDFEGDTQYQPKIEEEAKLMGSVKGKVYWNYIKSGSGAFLFVLTMLATLSSQALFHGTDFYLTIWTNREDALAEAAIDRFEFNNSLRGNGSDTFEHPVDETTHVIIFSGLILALFVTTLMRATLFFTYCMRASVNLHNNIFYNLLRAPMTLFDSNPVGRILNRFSRDMGIIDELLPTTAFDLNLNVCAVLGITITVAIINPYLVIPAVILFMVAFKIRGFYIKTGRDIKRFEGLTRSPIYSHLNTTVLGLPTIRAFGSQEAFENQFYRYLNDHSGTWFLHLCSSRALGVVMDWICLFYIIVVTIVLMVFPEGVPGGDAGLIMTSALSLMGMVQWTVRQTAEFEAQMTAVERILEYSGLESEAALETEKRPPPRWPQVGQISFKSVSLTYETSPKPVLSDLNFSIEGGEKVGIVGRTGAGKSSLLSSLFRMSEPQGSITIDGIDTKTIGLHDVRSKISIIPQDPVLFTGPVRHNIDPFYENNDEQLWKVLEEVQLKDVVNELPGQLDAHISEGGSNFSVGQRQLFCLARAMLRNNKILVLDEATANVDHETDALIQQTIRTKFKNCTVLTIAHRLNTIIDSDRVLVLDAGKVAEFDEPFHLLKQPRGLFRKLVKQTGHQMSRQLFSAAEETHSKKSSLEITRF